MENGEWRVESEEWRVESEEWRVESGEWRVENGLPPLGTQAARLRDESGERTPTSRYSPQPTMQAGRLRSHCTLPTANCQLPTTQAGRLRSH